MQDNGHKYESSNRTGVFNSQSYRRGVGEVTVAFMSTPLPDKTAIAYSTTSQRSGWFGEQNLHVNPNEDAEHTEQLVSATVGIVVAHVAHVKRFMKSETSN